MPEDRYANRLGITVTESAQGTLTFQELITGVGFQSKKGMLIDEIAYFIPIASTNLLIASNDIINFGITTTTGVTDLEDVVDSRILHSGSLQNVAIGTVGNFVHLRMPLVYQFFPSMIHAHIRIFLAVQSSSVASAVTVRVRVMWRFVDLKDAEIAELVQATLIQG